MTLDELKCDANFLYNVFPASVMRHIEKHAEVYRKFVSFIHLFGDEVVVRTWAYRRTTKNGLEYTEIERKCVSQDYAIRKNVYLSSSGGGYVPVFKPQVHASGNWYGYTYYYFDASDFDKWYTEKPMGLTTEIINIEKIFECEKYQYCGYSGHNDLIGYLRAYSKDPKVEYFGKLKIRYTKTLADKVKKDKGFVRFMASNTHDVNYYGARATIYAYENNMTIKDAYDRLNRRTQALRGTSHLEGIKETNVNRERLYDYINTPGIGMWNYADYWKATFLLGYDMNDTKNVYPKDFKRMHDLRINEYASFKAKKDAQERKEMQKRFRTVADEFKKYEFSNGTLSVIIPTSPKDLVKEGKTLHHCVGKMGYDKKMADRKCIIAFIREAADIDKPYVTAEYLFDGNRISQCYADHDSKPQAEVVEFANQWGAMITKVLKAQAK